jgi:hypothetical protein
MKTVTSVVENRDRFSTLRDTGWGCGYVTIPEGHPIMIQLLDDTQDNNFHLWVFGFSQEITLSMFLDNGDYKIGFDTAHVYNNSSHDEAWVRDKAEELKILVDAFTMEDAREFYNEKIGRIARDARELVKGLNL